MSDQRTRDRVIELIQQMRNRTIENGCTPAEAAGFAAKVAEWIEKYQIEEAELRAKDAGASPAEMEICENVFRTGKKVFNPGITQVFNGLSLGMCCRCIMMHERGEAVYGIIGDSLDADYVCQIATAVIPALQMMAKLEGAEHGYEKAGLVRWTNQYLMGAGEEIRKRLESERKSRSKAKEVEQQVTTGCTAVAVITGESLAVVKREKVNEAFNERYPRTKKTYSRSGYDHTANERGRAAGRNINLNRSIGGSTPKQIS